MLRLGECSIARCGYQGKLYNQSKYINIYFFSEVLVVLYEPPSKPKDDIYRVSRRIFAII